MKPSIVIPDRPWWERLFFWGIFLPVVRFSFKRMHIGAPGAMDAQGNITIFEEQGIYTEREFAESTCENEFWQVKPIPLDVGLPKESVQYKSHKYPKSVMPDRYRHRTFPAPVPLNQLHQIKRAFEVISEKATGI